MNKRSLIKDRITDGIGLIVWGLTIYLMYLGKIEWWPDFILGFAVGGVLFYIPDEWVTKHFKDWLIKKFGK